MVEVAHEGVHLDAFGRVERSAGGNTEFAIEEGKSPRVLLARVRPTGL